MNHTVSIAATLEDVLRVQEAGCDRANPHSWGVPVALLSFALVVGVPVAFWLALLEFAVPALGFGYGMAERVIIGGGLAMAATPAWAAIQNSSRLDNDDPARQA